MKYKILEIYQIYPIGHAEEFKHIDVVETSINIAKNLVMI